MRRDFAFVSSYCSLLYPRKISYFRVVERVGGSDYEHSFRSIYGAPIGVWCASDAICARLSTNGNRRAAPVVSGTQSFDDRSVVVGLSIERLLGRVRFSLRTASDVVVEIV